MTKIDMTNHRLAEAIKDALVADGEKVTSAGLVRAEGNSDEQLGVTGRKAVILGGSPRMLFGE